MYPYMSSLKIRKQVMIYHLSYSVEIDSLKSCKIKINFIGISQNMIFLDKVLYVDNF